MSPKSITSWPFWRGQQDLALASQSTPAHCSRVALILQEERGNKQQRQHFPLCPLVRTSVCGFAAASESKVSLGLGNKVPG